jgi:L-fucose isomerase-like protein
MVVTGKPLRVQPVLMYATSSKREAASWKSWGGVQSEQAASEEANRIAGELDTLSAQADFGMDILPVIKVKSVEQAKEAQNQSADVTLVYPATGSGNVLRACLAGEGDRLIFVRHRSGPVYYWYEALSVRYLATDDSDPSEPRRVSVHDVVVDDYQEVLWRLRALYGVKNFSGTRIVALGGPGGKYAREAPEKAQQRHGIEIISVSYTDVEPRIQGALANTGLVAQAEQWTTKYLAAPNVQFETDRAFVVNAFVLCTVFKDLMREHDAPAFTIKECMSTILPMSKTTACLTLSLLNDEGLMAFCESDFVIIPSGILLHYISGKPVFLHNSTFPHKGIVTCAHCTGPRRMDGTRYEPARILTHYESEYGAAPKVEMPKGQEVTFIDPEYDTGRWVGFKGNVEDNPFLEICRSQQDVRIQGNWERLLNEVRDSHWVMVYGDYLKEVGFAAPRIGITWENISEA